MSNSTLQAHLQQIYGAYVDSNLVAAIVSEIEDQYEPSDLDMEDKPASLQYVLDTLDTLATDAAKVLNEDRKELLLQTDLDTHFDKLHLSSRNCVFNMDESSSGSEDARSGSHSDTIAKTMSTSSATDHNSIEFLKVAFPGKPEGYLRHALYEAGGNVQATIDNLLSIEFLENEKESRQCHDRNDLSYSELNQNKSKRKRHKEKQTKLVVSLTDMKHRANKMNCRATSQRNTETEPDPTDNKWVTVNSEIAFLAKAFGQSSTKVMSVHHGNGLNMRATIFELISAREEMKNCNEDDANLGIQVDEINELSVLFPHHDRSLIGRVMTAVNGSQSDAVDILFKLDESPFLVPIGMNNKNSRSHASLHADKFIERKITLSTHEDDQDELRDPAGCRALALEYIDKRDEAYRKAGDSYRRARSEGSCTRTYGGAALFYAEQGRDYDAKARNWNMLASRGFVKQQSSDRIIQNQGTARSQKSIDLHGLSVKDAIVIAREETNAWYARTLAQTHSLSSHNSGNLHTSGFVIVTGSGLHSNGGNARLRPAVRKSLEKDGWRVSESLDGGSVIVHGVKKA